jgi:hypothetical protein
MKALLFPVVSAEKWAKQYSLSVSDSPCENCGKILSPTKPFATGGWRGLTSEPHNCGGDYDLFVAAKATAAGRRELIEYFNVLQGTVGA